VPGDSRRPPRGRPVFRAARPGRTGPIAHPGIRGCTSAAIVRCAVARMCDASCPMRTEACRMWTPATTGRTLTPATTSRRRTAATRGRALMAAATGHTLTPATAHSHGDDEGPNLDGGDGGPQLDGSDRGRTSTAAATGRSLTPATTGRTSTAATRPACRGSGPAREAASGPGVIRGVGRTAWVCPRAASR
jgi:hypothetical protein